MTSILEAHNVKVYGTGEKVAFLSHGFGTDQTAWKHVASDLVRDHRVVVYDMMGAGTTNADSFSFSRYSSLHAYADDVLAILDELGVERCIYVGHSVSSMIGFLASIERPQVFEKIVCFSASPRYLNDENYFGGNEVAGLEALFEAMSSNYKTWVAGFAPLAVLGPADSPGVQEFSRTLFSLRPDIALSVSRTIYFSDYRAILPQVSVPVHLLQSRNDLAVPEFVTNYVASHLQNCVVEYLPIEGHLPHLAQPELMTEAIRRHIEQPP
eukprot:TRINITY_DN18929_c0_g1_i1.p1 TRINITY_DN18929_c0_g1~~TRINITY_DN18929_c0_g1_i1.p1  ORF type:complete len:268 (-),score=49.88 TRINITY_DN18929_c0_g1_i1:254-1057(-)